MWRRFWREAPLAEIGNRKGLVEWLRGKPCEVSLALAVRMALRVLPAVSLETKEANYLDTLVSPVFRATGVAFAAATYPAQATKLSVNAHAAAVATRVPTAGAAHRAAVAVNNSNSSTARATAAAAASAAERAIPADARAAFWSAISIDATRVEKGAAASVIAGSPLWPQGQPDQLQSLWQEMKAALLAARQDWLVWILWYDLRLSGHCRDEELELAYVRIEEALWDQGPAIVNAEITRRIQEIPPPIAGAAAQPLSEIFAAWQSADAAPQTPPPRRQYVPDVLFNPVALADTPPAPIENVPSAVSFGWSSKGTITVVLSELNWPAFPFKGGEQIHKHCLEACRVLAAGMARSLRSGKWNARSDYAETLDQYVAYLPKQPEEGNFLLADAKARVIRAMFAAEQDFLPAPFGAELKILLEQHIGLRAYYPATEDFYESVRSGHLETPLPIDAAEGFIRSVRDNTPTLFEPNVADTLENTAQPIPAISPVDLEATKSDIARPAPPPDPLGEVDPKNSQRFTLASGINALWKVVSSGKKADENLEGWLKVMGTLGPYAAPVLKWLRSYVSGV